MYGTDVVLNAPGRDEIAIGSTITVTHKPQGGHYDNVRYDLVSEVTVDAAWPLADGGFYFGGTLPRDTYEERFGTPMPLAEFDERYGQKRLQVVMYPEGHPLKGSCCTVTERLPISA